MTPGLAIVALMLLSLWLVAFSSFRLRNWRAFGLGAFGTLLIVAVGLLPWPAAQLLQGGVWTAILVVFVLRSDLVGVMSAAEYDFVDQYTQILRRLVRLRRRVRQTDALAYVREFERVIDSVEGLEAPAAWKELHRDTGTELRRRLTRIKLNAIPLPDEQREAEARWREIEQHFDQILTIRGGFWKGWLDLGPRGGI
jgi:hypothetical protein